MITEVDFAYSSDGWIVGGASKFDRKYRFVMHTLYNSLEFLGIIIYLCLKISVDLF